MRQRVEGGHVLRGAMVGFDSRVRFTLRRPPEQGAIGPTQGSSASRASRVSRTLACWILRSVLCGEFEISCHLARVAPSGKLDRYIYRNIDWCTTER